MIMVHEGELDDLKNQNEWLESYSPFHHLRQLFNSTIYKTILLVYLCLTNFKYAAWYIQRSISPLAIFWY